MFYLRWKCVFWGVNWGREPARHVGLMKTLTEWPGDVNKGAGAPLHHGTRQYCFSLTTSRILPRAAHLLFYYYFPTFLGSRTSSHQPAWPCTPNSIGRSSVYPLVVQYMYPTLGNPDCKLSSTVSHLSTCWSVISRAKPKEKNQLSVVSSGSLFCLRLAISICFFIFVASEKRKKFL